MYIKKTHQWLRGPIGCPMPCNNVKIDKRNCPYVPPIYHCLKSAIKHIKYLDETRPHPPRNVFDKLPTNCKSDF